MSQAIASIPPSIQRSLLGADIRPECSVGLLRTMRAFTNLEPWALRLFDATGKYPTGLLQGSRADVGAFDECLETVVRDSFGHDISHGQYCNLLVYVKNASAFEGTLEAILPIMHPVFNYYKKYFTYKELPVLRIGICFLDDCSRQDLQNIADAVKPPIIDIKVSNCATAEPEPWSTTETALVIFLGFLVVVIAAATWVDLFVPAKPRCGGERSTLVDALTSFSAAENTRTLLRVAKKADADSYALQCVHGIRLLCLAHIVLGHTYAAVSDIWSRHLNLLVESQYWPCMALAAGFNGVDTFFFLSGFFLSLTVTKQKGRAPVVFIVGILRRLIRTCVPLFFMIICLYVSPLFVTGPDVKTFFLRFHEEVVEHWWHWLLQIKNFYEMGPTILLGHTWFLSADFQLFLVAFLTLLLLKSRKTLALGAFILLSLISYVIVAWTLASDSDVLPFLIIPAQTPEVAFKTVNIYYQRPFYHAMCYFSGCITFLIMDDFRQRKITKAMRLAGWCMASACMLCCVFMKIAWYRSPNPTSVVGNLLAAFSDRFLWSVFLAWTMLVCSTGRGGVVAKFLSCDVFVPLSKLSFGVYLIHLPFIELMAHASRERLYFSHFTQISTFFSVLVWGFLLSYLAYLACEGPTSGLEKLAFGRLTGSVQSRRKEHQFQQNEAHTGADRTKSSHF